MFVYGDYYYASAEVRHGLPVDKLVLLCNLVPTPIFADQSAAMQSVIYKGDLLLGRKAESIGTKSTLDETMMQKYTNRLLDLWQLWQGHISGFMCANGYICKGTEGKVLINFLSENIDYVGCELTIE
jgi:hypothetical protein